MYQAWESREKCKVLMGKPEGKRSLRILRLRLEDGVRMDLGGDWLGGGVDSVGLG
jgi:hypothetical protein